jgi:diguanylate cyclase (GGDEF)-like protein
MLDDRARFFHDVKSGHQSATRQVDTPRDAMVRQFRAELRNGVDRDTPLQCAEYVAAGDEDRRYLLIRFRSVGRDGLPLFGNVALDVTRHDQRLDQLAQLAVEDELTGLYNRRGFLQFAQHELRSARRHKTRCAVIFLDIDGLKQINDRFGHAHGNERLKSLARLLRQAFRECDVIARLGGDEFAVFAADVRGEPAELVQRIRAQLAANGDALGDFEVSAGVASCEPGEATELLDLLAAADRAMYEEKSRKLAAGSPGLDSPAT